ncbi:Matrix protein 1 [Frankliniella fusca]|uniref:Matrix protein 1 n=1 Tax=Frankliniella fusca TaxID=407009 RepID=A0AAE1HDA3_9NEOP|nr:Matrix protein 1 [Frankliniella fusca]
MMTPEVFDVDPNVCKACIVNSGEVSKIYSSDVLADERSSYRGAVDTSHAFEYLVTKFLNTTFLVKPSVTMGLLPVPKNTAHHNHHYLFTSVKQSDDKWCLMDRLHSWNRGKHLFLNSGLIWRYVLLI